MVFLEENTGVCNMPLCSPAKSISFNADIFDRATKKNGKNINQPESSTSIISSKEEHYNDCINLSTTNVSMSFSYTYLY